MPKNFTIFCLLISLLTFLLGLFYPTYSYAAVYPTCSPNETTCDLCGWCGRCPPTPIAGTPFPSIAPSPYNWEKCYECIYPNNLYPSPEQQKYYTVVGCITTKEGPFVQTILRVIFGIAGGLAFLSVLYGSIVVLTSKGNPENIQNGKDIITSSIIGLFLIIFSVLLMKIIGVDILKLPGMG
jgi:hypothetical protein